MQSREAAVFAYTSRSRTISATKCLTGFARSVMGGSMLLNCKSMLQTRPRLACSSRSLFRQPTVWETEWESCSSMSSTATTIYLARSSTQSSSGTTQSPAPPHGSRLSKSSQMTLSVRRRKWKTYASSTSLSRRRSLRTKSARFVLAISART